MNDGERKGFVAGFFFLDDDKIDECTVYANGNKSLKINRLHALDDV